jgi:hypothetical protein
MACYIVTFEVANTNNKAKLKERLKTYGTYCPINDNCWAIVTNQTAVQIRDHLMELILASDKIFVIKSGVEAAWRNVYSQENTDWLKEKL